MDPISAYLFLLQKKYEEAGEPLRRDAFHDIGRDVELFPGVETWFRRINAYGLEKDFMVEHYIISSGMSEVLEAVGIAHEFKRIYACRYYYDEDGNAKWPARIVNYTTKTQYMFRINKQVLDENDDASLNEFVRPADRPIPFTRMIYIADGFTDVPCMRLVKEYGGKSIAVYNDSKDIARKLHHDGRVNFISPADYREGNDLEVLVKQIIDHMYCDEVLAEREKEDDK
jgi:phosphoglycolate phosphatase-like HAD superfamily hydrolase